MNLSQAKFSEYIGVSKKTVTLMKQKKQIIMSGTKVEVEKSIELLKSIGRNFDKDNKMITSNTVAVPAEEKQSSHLLNTDFIYPTLTADEKQQQNTREVEAMKKEAKEHGLSMDKVLTNEISMLETIEANKIKIFWQGQLERLKYEKEKGLLISKEEVEEDQFLVARTIRDAFMSMSNRITHQLIGKTEAHQIKNIIDMETYKVMENLSR